MPLFSVIIPVYKVEAYLFECVDSILQQTYTDFELILVDDGSPDNCGKICDEYASKDERIHVIHKENGGVTSARLAGAEAAVGTYIVCIDGDDWVKSSYLEKFAECIGEYSPDLLCCGFVEVYPKRTIEKTICSTDEFYDKERIQNYIFPSLIENKDGSDVPSYICGKAIRRNLFVSQLVTVNKNLTIWEDELVGKTCLYYANSIFFIKDCMYYYRRNSSSVTNVKKAMHWDYPMIVGQHYESHIDMGAFDFQEQVYRRIVTFLYVDAMSQFFRKESYKSIVCDIKTHLQEPYYQNAIDKCCFRGSWKMQLKRFVLKHHICRYLWLHNCVCIYQKNALSKKSRKFEK